MPLSHEPDPYIAHVTALTMNTLIAAERESSVKRVVITSSSMAAVNPASDIQQTITVNTWNETVLEDARKEPYGPDNVMNVYGASKTDAEMKAWKWMAENQPHFVMNSILPNTNFGPAIGHQYQRFTSTDAMLKQVCDGDAEPLASDPPRE
jgi:nucleoside-diphosphate-sugar epimerase